MIRANPVVTFVDTGGALPCVVLDNILDDPEKLVASAVAHRAAFQPAAANAYPGLELPLPDSVVQLFIEAFGRHARAALDVRRIVEGHGRLGLVTRTPDALSPIQRLCHRDRLLVGPDQRAIAGVLYLFRDPALGGTNFFTPRAPLATVEELMGRAAHMDDAEADRVLGLPRRYLTSSNDWFQFNAAIEGRFNRLIFFDGGGFHGSHILRPDLLSDQPDQGRLTLNLFFIGRRNAR